MSDKYELINPYVSEYGMTLYRIRALKHFGSVPRGQIGGHIEKEANLSQTGLSWVGNGSVVYGDARVSDDAIVGFLIGKNLQHAVRVYDQAHIYGRAYVEGRVKVYGQAKIYDRAEVSDDARVYGEAQIYGSANVYGYAKIHGKAQIFNNATIFTKKQFTNVEVCGNAKVYNNAQIYYSGPDLSSPKICDNATVYGNARISGDMDGNSQAYGNAIASLVTTRKFMVTLV